MERRTTRAASSRATMTVDRTKYDSSHRFAQRGEFSSTTLNETGSPFTRPTSADAPVRNVLFYQDAAGTGSSHGESTLHLVPQPPQKPHKIPLPMQKALRGRRARQRRGRRAAPAPQRTLGSPRAGGSWRARRPARESRGRRARSPSASRRRPGRRSGGSRPQGVPLPVRPRRRESRRFRGRGPSPLC